ncbi:MAG TPA: efflux RND transporter permease subunit [Candidatus Binatia bacterium]|nr:efflux RND transporter permease subunit [Candidatus Binatia bacterium]
MQKLAEICIRRPVFAAMMNLALVIVGAVSLSRLGVDRLPSVDIPSVLVRTNLPGASPTEIETELTDRIEEAVNTVQGIDELRSISMPERSLVIANFNLERQIDIAAQDVRDRVSGAMRNLPEDTDPPVVAKFDSDSEPVMIVAVTGPRSIRELTEIADKVVRIRLERAAGVGQVTLKGGLSRTMNVWVDADRLDAHGLSITAVRDAIAAQNADVPGGNVTTADREVALRTAGRFVDAKGFDDLVVRTVDGVPVRVRDLGHAEDGTAEQRTIATLNGAPTVTLEIIRQSDANTVAVIEGVKRILEGLRGELPADVRTDIIRDQSNYIYAALHEINTHLIVGSILASIVVLIFMRNWRSTIIAAVAIPTSIVATFGVMYALDFTLNSITMLALVLMVGVVIDDAIVVLENIFRFVEEKGMSPREAAKHATAEIGLAVLATTFSLVVIFVPVSFMSSVAGRFLYQFGITASVAVLVSLFVSFTLTPMMASRMLRAAPAVGHGAGGAEQAPASRAGFYAWIDARYTRLIEWSMAHRTAVMILAVVIGLASVPFYQGIGREFVPTDVDEAEFNISILAPEGASLASMRAAMDLAEHEIEAVRGVRDVLITTGGFAGSQVNSANVHVRIAPHEERLFSFTRLLRETVRLRPWRAFMGNYPQSEVMTEIDARLRKFPDLRAQVRNYQSFNVGGGSFDVNFIIRGPELGELYRYGEELRAKAMEAGGFRGLDTSLRLNKPELHVEIDRDRAADLGVSARDIGTALRLRVGGDEEVSRFHDPQTNEQYEVRLRLVEEDRNRPEIIDQLKLPSANGGLVELGSVAAVERVESASRIDRLDRQRMIAVRGGVAPGYDLGGRIDLMNELAAGLGMPLAYSTSTTGRSRELERTFNEFALAFGLSIVFMYLILASQFESLTHPFTILLSLPLSVPFALLSLWMYGGTLNVFSALGVLVLFGVVKKNAILQIDHMNTLRAQGVPRAEAILQANRDRLRPILMTTLSLVAGMAPLALGSGPGAEERRAVAVVVVGGQTLCLLLTLLVTPVAYSVFDDLGTARVRQRIWAATLGRLARAAGRG